MKPTRKIHTYLYSLSLLLFLPALHAAEVTEQFISEKDKQIHETTGVLGGAVVGGLIGGPIGAVVTAAFGGWVSDKTLAKKKNVLLVAQLDNQRKELLAMQAEYRALQARHQVALRNAEIASARNVSLSQNSLQRNQGVAVCCQDTELSLHFKTGSTVIEPLYNSKLNEFAVLAKQFPETVIEITGHADRRGDSKANLSLSQERIKTVEQRLRQLGISKTSFKTSAFGESKPASAEDSLENNFFDRRVVLKILSAGNGLLTRTDD